MLLVLCAGSMLQAQTQQELKVTVASGYTASSSAPFFLRLLASPGVTIDKTTEWRGVAGAGHLAQQTYLVRYDKAEIKPVQGMHVIWSDLIAHSDAGTVQRLTQDPAWRVDARKLTFELNPEGTQGFSLTVDQLLEQKTFWVPALDLYVSTGDVPASYAEIQKQLAPYAGLRVLDQLKKQPEASYAEYKAKWADMGSPDMSTPSRKGRDTSYALRGIRQSRSSVSIAEPECGMTTGTPTSFGCGTSSGIGGRHQSLLEEPDAARRSAGGDNRFRARPGALRGGAVRISVEWAPQRDAAAMCRWC